MAELAHEGTGYEVVEAEPPEILARNLSAAGYLLAGATSFFFLSFVFAYLYLRSLNSAHMWKPKGIDTSVAWGTVIVACAVASALLVRWGAIDQRSGRRPAWRMKGLLALLLGLAGVVVQAVAWTQQGFGPTDGGFASVYFGWTAFLFLFEIGALFWLETVLATSYRYRDAKTESAPDVARDIRNPVTLNTAELSALGFYWTFLAGIAILSWVFLYLL
jgi:heme/copper-type cytochrome/quinol oxidase subunit 3